MAAILTAPRPILLICFVQQAAIALGWSTLDTQAGFPEEFALIRILLPLRQALLGFRIPVSYTHLTLPTICSV